MLTCNRLSLNLGIDAGAIFTADAFATLNFRHAMQVVASPRLKAQTEEKVCEAVIGWLETHHYDAIMAELELRDDLIHKLQSVTIPVQVDLPPMRSSTLIYIGLRMLAINIDFSAGSRYEL